MNWKRMTYEELRDALNKLSPEQLKMPVLWAGDDRGGVIGGVDILEEEYVNFGEGLEPWISYEGGEYTKEEAVATYPAGTVFLMSDVPPSG